MIKDIDSLIVNGEQSLQDYSDAQFHTIKSLEQKIATLESENRSLKSMLSHVVPDLELGHIGNEQLICETQIVLLKEAAVGRALTMEESKKFQIFVTVLESIKLNNKNQDWNVKRLSEDELIKLAVDNGS